MKVTSLSFRPLFLVLTLICVSHCCNEERGQDRIREGEGEREEGFCILWLGFSSRRRCDDHMGWEELLKVHTCSVPVTPSSFMAFFGASLVIFSPSACYYHGRYCFLPIILSFFLPHSCHSLHNMVLVACSTHVRCVLFVCFRFWE